MTTWHSNKFRFRTVPGSQPRWWLDIFLLDGLVRDIVAQCDSPASLWRIHRRYADDDAGHEFNLLSFGDDSFHAINDRAVSVHPALTHLRSAGVLREFLVTDDGTGIGATSDLNWSPAVQSTWPYYIHGVSRMALGLVDALRDSPRPDPVYASFDEIESYYTPLCDRFVATWQEQGSHAFLHHLNAIFGYAPVDVQPRWVSGMRVVF